MQWLLVEGYGAVTRGEPRRVRGPGAGTPRSGATFSRGKERLAMDDSERGKPASFDRRTGAVHGSGSGAGGGGNPDEDYDQDPENGSGKEDFGRPRPAGAAVDRPIDPDEGT
jgi:hypothetical protein